MGKNTFSTHLAEYLAEYRHTENASKMTAEHFSLPRSTVATWIKNQELRDAPPPQVVAPPAPPLPHIENIQGGNYELFPQEEMLEDFEVGFLFMIFIIAMLYMETQPFMMNDILRLITILWIIRNIDVICGDMISEL